jgi:hypothetical protein
VKDVGLGRCESPNLDMAGGYGLVIRCKQPAVRHVKGALLCGRHCESFHPPMSEYAFNACRRIGIWLDAFPALWGES